MTICMHPVESEDATYWASCNTKMVFSLERRTWYCPECGNQVRVPREQQSLNEFTRKS